MNHLEVKEALKKAFQEDVGMGDLTTDAIFPSNEMAEGYFVAKGDGVFAGAAFIEQGYSLFSPETEIHFLKGDGQPIKKGDTIATVKAPVRTLLTSERVILNFIQHLSGIATITRNMIHALGDPSITITDTRKTLPGLRSMQKYAVACGGGRNHRFRLDDGVMIKDNHIKAAGSIYKAVELVRAKIGHMVKVEVETESEEQVLQAVEANVDVIMLDNQGPESVKKLVEKIPDHIVVEVSGGITPETIHEYKNCGADVISLGWITHSVKALDISFNID